MYARSQRGLGTPTKQLAALFAESTRIIQPVGEYFIVRCQINTSPVRYYIAVLKKEEGNENGKFRLKADHYICPENESNPGQYVKKRCFLIKVQTLSSDLNQLPFKKLIADPAEYPKEALDGKLKRSQWNERYTTRTHSDPHHTPERLDVLATQIDAQQQKQMGYSIASMYNAPNIRNSGDAIKPPLFDTAKRFSVEIIPYSPGEDLYNFSKTFEFTQMGFKEKIDLILQILGEVATLHQCDVIHGDLKPENIIYDHATKKTSLIDFESAAVERQNIVPLSTPGFIAPENFKYDTQPQGIVIRSLVGNSTKAQDIYCLAGIIGFLLFGEPFLPSRTKSEILQLNVLLPGLPRYRFDRINSHVNSDLSNIIDHLKTDMAHDSPRERKDIGTHIQFFKKYSSTYVKPQFFYNQRKPLESPAPGAPSRLDKCFKPGSSKR